MVDLILPSGAKTASRSTKAPTTPTFMQRDSFSDMWQALNACRICRERGRPATIEYCFVEWQTGSEYSLRSWAGNKYDCIYEEGRGGAYRSFSPQS